jgi:hypothetical protein
MPWVAPTVCVISALSTLSSSERGLLEPFAGLRPEGVGAGQALAIAEQRQEAVGLRVRAGVRLGERVVEALADD